MRACALVCLLLLAACSEQSNANNGQRIVEQDRLDNPIVPLEHVDSAVQTEAITAMNLIARQVNLKVADGRDTTTFYRSISGTVNASTLSKLGLTESHLTGTNYKPSDYSIVIVGKTMTISAAEIGTRGRVEPKTFRVP